MYREREYIHMYVFFAVPPDHPAPSGWPRQLYIYVGVYSYAHIYRCICGYMCVCIYIYIAYTWMSVYSITGSSCDGWWATAAIHMYMYMHR